jgi:small-conductance mechanosensitive channel
VAQSLVASALLALVVWLAYRASDRALARLTSATAPRAISMLGAAVWSVVEGFRRACVRFTAWAVALVAAYLWLTFVLRAFPYSRPWSDRLGGYLSGLLSQLATGALGALPGLFTVVLIFLITRGVVRLVDAAFQSVETGALRLGGLHPDTARATRRIAGTIIWVFALTVAYEYIPGSDSEAFKAIGVFAGLMVSLGSASFVSHVMGGLVVAYSRAVRVGEVVKAGDIVGRVTEVGLLSTRLVTPRREEITIPNGTLAAQTVTNYSRLAGNDGIVIATTVTIGYDAPWRQVHALLQLAAERTPNVRKEPKPTVVQRALGDFAVQYELRAHIDDAVDRSRAISDLHAQIQDSFNEFGVQIMSPAFESQPDGAVVVPRARWFAAPAPPPDGSRTGS